MLNLSRQIMITFCFHICVCLWKFPMTGMWWRRQMLERCRQRTACCQRQPLSLAAYPRLCPTSPRLLVCILTSLWCPRHDFNNICIVVFMVWFSISFFCASAVLVIFVTMAECSLLMLMIRSVIFFNFNFQCSHFRGELRLASPSLRSSSSIHSRRENLWEQEAFEKCWAHSPLGAAACHIDIHQVSLLSRRTPPAHRCLQWRWRWWQQQHVTGDRFGPMEWAQLRGLVCYRLRASCTIHT